MGFAVGNGFVDGGTLNSVASVILLAERSHWCRSRISAFTGADNTSGRPMGLPVSRARRCLAMDRSRMVGRPSFGEGQHHGYLQSLDRRDLTQEVKAANLAH